MVAVAIAEQEVAVVVELVPLVVGSILENVSLLFQATADETIKISEPILEFWIVIGVTVDLVD